MIRLAAFMILMSLAISALGQDETLFPQDQTLFPEESKSGYFGGPVLKATQMHDEFGLLVGARGGWVVNRKVVLGLSAHYLVNSIGIETTVPDTIAPVDTTFDMVLAYGDVEFEYISESHNLIHTPMFRIGLGLIYRYVKDVEIKGVDDDDLTGFNGVLTAKIGRL